MSHSRFALGFTRHKKVHKLSDAAFRLWVSAVDYASEQATNGRITVEDVDLFPKCPKAGARRDELIVELEALGLWEVAPGGWQIHDFLDWQDSADVVERRRESARERMREVRAVRSQRGSHDVRANVQENFPNGSGEVPNGPSISSPSGDGLPLDSSGSDQPDPSLLKDLKASARVQEKTVAHDVFDFWKSDTGHERAVLDAKRERRILARFREGFTIDRMCAAIHNRKNDPFLMGQNDTGTVYDGIDTLLRDAAQVERLERLTQPPKPRGMQRGPQPKQPNSGEWKPPVEA